MLLSNECLRKSNFFYYFLKKFNIDGKDYKFIEEESISMFDDDELNEMRRIRLLDIIHWSILNEFCIYSLFLLVLFTISFYNLNNSSFIYNRLFFSTFVNQQSQSDLGLGNVFIIYFHFIFSLWGCTAFLWLYTRKVQYGFKNCA